MDSDSCLPPQDPQAIAGNNIAGHATFGPGGTLVTDNPNPDRGGTQLAGGSAGMQATAHPPNG
jgi:hypothetical protein